MNLLITGINGFVGTNIVRALSSKYTIYGIGRNQTKRDGVETIFTWDDLDSGIIPKIDVVIHLAGKAHDTKNRTDEKIYFDVNTGLTQKIYDWFLGSDAQKFIFFSSVKAAADTVHGFDLQEDVIPSPKGPYGESKLKAELYIKHKWPIDKAVYILRPCMIHGPGNKGNLNLLYQVVKTGMPWPLGSFENHRTFTSIDNLCYVIDCFISRTVASGIYNMADDEALSTNELIQIMCDVMGKQTRILHLPKSVMEKTAKFCDVLHLPLTTERLMKLTENYIVSNFKIKKALGITTMPVSARDGLYRTIKSFLVDKK